MAANTAPVFPLTPNAGVQNVLLSTAMTNTKAYEGTDTPGTALALIYTVGANGGRVDSVNVQFTSTAAATASGTSSATVVRFWLNNGSAQTTATNNQLLGELAIPAATIVALATAVNPTYSLAINKSYPAGYKIYAGTTVAVGGTNIALQPSAIGGDY